MCLHILLFFAAYVAVMVFFETARILLPWTASSAVVAALAGLAAGRLLSAASPSRPAVCCLLTFFLTIALGYLGFLAVPPTPPPPKPERAGFEGLMDKMTELPKPQITSDELFTMLPVHLSIAGGLALACVLAVASGTQQPPKRRKPLPLDGDSAEDGNRGPDVRDAEPAD